MKKLNIATKSGVVLYGALFSEGKTDTVMIAITGIHGNFYSNPFYYNIGETLSENKIDFIYAQTRDAFNQTEIINKITGKKEIIGSWNENFYDTIEDIKAYVDYAEQQGYRKIILAGHSLGANKVIYYLSQMADGRVDKFILLSPANVEYLTGFITENQREYIVSQVKSGNGEKMLPFEIFGWLPCTADTAYQWLYSDILNNVHVEADRDYSQIQSIKHTGALIIGTYDRFTYGSPVEFLEMINKNFINYKQNEMIFIEKTGHTYQLKEQELANSLLNLIKKWNGNI